MHQSARLLLLLDHTDECLGGEKLDRMAYEPMVLVYDKPRNAIGILQTKLRYREGHEARRSGLETIPLDQYVEGRHGEGEPGVKIRPDPVHDLFEMADECQHREHRLDEHTVLPRAALTQFEVGWIPLGGMEGRKVLQSWGL